MYLGVTKIVMLLPGNDSLKGKRAVLRRTMDRVRARFSAVCAEVGAQDNHGRAEIGCAVLSGDATHAQTMIDKVAAFVERDAREPILEIRKGVTRWSPVARELDEGLL